jgi:hypothetical protein
MVYRPRRYDQRGSDFRVAHAGREQVEHVDLALGQPGGMRLGRLARFSHDPVAERPEFPG